MAFVHIFDSTENYPTFLIPWELESVTTWLPARNCDSEAVSSNPPKPTA